MDRRTLVWNVVRNSDFNPVAPICFDGRAGEDVVDEQALIVEESVWVAIDSGDAPLVPTCDARAWTFVVVICVLSNHQWEHIIPRRGLNTDSSSSTAPRISLW